MGRWIARFAIRLLGGFAVFMISIALMSVTLASILPVKFGIVISVVLAIWVDRKAFGRRRRNEKQIELAKSP